MRVLVTIPHYCRVPEDGPGHHGSERDATPRIAAVSRCIEALHQTFGPHQALQSPGLPPCNTTLQVRLDIALVTNGVDHLVPQLPPGLFLHCPTAEDARNLGFACQRLMREAVGAYDLYVYLEDDLAITDPLFLVKLDWFARTFGPSALLQPNRFEQAIGLNVQKLYLDGAINDDASTAHQDITRRPRLTAELFGRSFLFQRVPNPHSGCFFVTAQQLERLALSPVFGAPSEQFIGPLETAATMMIMRAFDVYKPARENAGFLEVQHLGHRYLVASDPILAGAMSP